VNWPKDGKLQEGQTGHPVLWHRTLDELGYEVSFPRLDPGWFLNFWGDDRTSQRLKTFGHQREKDSTSPHFVCTRGGLPTDPGYTRYAMQIQLFNGGFCVYGLEDDLYEMPLFMPGLAILLDTWSPHLVARDSRLPQLGVNKVLVGSDFAEPPNIEAELPKLLEHIPNFR
jgi:hypothetical protein